MWRLSRLRSSSKIERKRYHDFLERVRLDCNAASTAWYWSRVRPIPASGTRYRPIPPVSIQYRYRKKCFHISTDTAHTSRLCNENNRLLFWLHTSKKEAVVSVSPYTEGTLRRRFTAGNAILLLITRFSAHYGGRVTVACQPVPTSCPQLQLTCILTLHCTAAPSHPSHWST